MVQTDAMLQISHSWNASVPMAARATCPVMATTGILSAFAPMMPVIKLVAPGPEVGDANAGFAGHAGINVSSVGSRLFVPDQNVAQLRIGPQRVVEGEDCSARMTKQNLYSLSEQALANYFRSFQLHGESPCIVDLPARPFWEYP